MKRFVILWIKLSQQASVTQESNLILGVKRVDKFWRTFPPWLETEFLGDNTDTQINKLQQIHYKVMCYQKHDWENLVQEKCFKKNQNNKKRKTKITNKWKKKLLWTRYVL